MEEKFDLTSAVGFFSLPGIIENVGEKSDLKGKKEDFSFFLQLATHGKKNATRVTRRRSTEHGLMV